MQDTLHFESLLEMSHEMRKQHNRMTQYPLWIIQEVFRIPASPEMGYDVKVRNEEHDEDLYCDDCRRIASEGTWDDVDDCDECDDECFLFYKEEYRSATQAGGVFLTEKACHDHMESNSYHFNKPRSYVISAYRNPEMVRVMQFILSLTGDVPSHYQ